MPAEKRKVTDAAALAEEYADKYAGELSMSREVCRIKALALVTAELPVNEETLGYSLDEIKRKAKEDRIDIDWGADTEEVLAEVDALMKQGAKEEKLREVGERLHEEAMKAANFRGACEDRDWMLERAEKFWRMAAKTFTRTRDNAKAATAMKNSAKASFMRGRVEDSAKSLVDSAESYRKADMLEEAAAASREAARIRFHLRDPGAAAKEFSAASGSFHSAGLFWEAGLSGIEAAKAELKRKKYQEATRSLYLAGKDFIAAGEEGFSVKCSQASNYINSLDLGNADSVIDDMLREASERRGSPQWAVAAAKPAELEATQERGLPEAKEGSGDLKGLYAALNRMLRAGEDAEGIKALSENIEVRCRDELEDLKSKDLGGENIGVFAAALYSAGRGYLQAGSFRKAVELGKESSRLFSEVGDRGGEAESLVLVAAAYSKLGERREAAKFSERVGNIGLADGRAQYALKAYGLAADMREELGEYERAGSIRKRSAYVYIRAKNREGMAKATYELAAAAKDYTKAHSQGKAGECNLVLAWINLRLRGPDSLKNAVKALGFAETSYSKQQDAKSAELCSTASYKLIEECSVEKTLELLEPNVEVLVERGLRSVGEEEEPEKTEAAAPAEEIRLRYAHGRALEFAKLLNDAGFHDFSGETTDGMTDIRIGVDNASAFKAAVEKNAAKFLKKKFLVKDGGGFCLKIGGESYGLKLREEKKAKKDGVTWGQVSKALDGKYGEKHIDSIVVLNRLAKRGLLSKEGDVYRLHRDYESLLDGISSKLPLDRFEKDVLLTVVKKERKKVPPSLLEGDVGREVGGG